MMVGGGDISEGTIHAKAAAAKANASAKAEADDKASRARAKSDAAAAAATAAVTAAEGKQAAIAVAGDLLVRAVVSVVGTSPWTAVGGLVDGAGNSGVAGAIAAAERLAKIQGGLGAGAAVAGAAAAAAAATAAGTATAGVGMGIIAGGYLDDAGGGVDRRRRGVEGSVAAASHGRRHSDAGAVGGSTCPTPTRAGREPGGVDCGDANPDGAER
jgi:hypothetical protein